MTNNVRCSACYEVFEVDDQIAEYPPGSEIHAKCWDKVKDRLKAEVHSVLIRMNHGDKFSYPLTIIADRYGGCYTGGKFLAFPWYAHEIPPESQGDDVTINEWWSTTNGTQFVGRGENPHDAYLDMMKRIIGASGDNTDLNFTIYTQEDKDASTKAQKHWTDSFIEARKASKRRRWFAKPFDWISSKTMSIGMRIKYPPQKESMTGLPMGPE